MADIFISYASEDRQRIKPLVAALEGAGYSLWWDQELRGGTRFSSEIETELTSASVVIVVWSPKAVTSRWVADEADLALETGNLLPLSLDGARAPLGFRQLQTIEFSDWSGGDAPCLQDLLSALEHHIESGERRPNQPVSLPASENIKSDASIAVLPFVNLSSDPEQEYFADGIVEDLITSISRFPWLFVVSRSTCFSYKGRRIQASQAVEELGVRYIVEGSVRKAGNRLRVTVQLIDATKDRHVWAENYDRPAGDLFDVQDEICASITGMLIPALSNAERESCGRETRPDLNAWVAFQRGLHHYYRPFSLEDHKAARKYFDQAIELDSEFSDAYAMIALMGVYSVNSGQTSYQASRKEIVSEAMTFAERAVQLNDKNAMGHVARGRVHQLYGHHDLAISDLQTAVELNPNLAVAHYELGFALNVCGRMEESIASLDRAIRLSPNDPSRWNFYLVKGIALMGLGECDKAFESFKTSQRMRPTAIWPYLGFVGVHMRQGEQAEASKVVRYIRAQHPDWTVNRVKKIFHHHQASHFGHWVEDLRGAGMTEE